MLKIKDNVNLKELEKFGFDFVVEGRIREYRHRETKEQLIVDAETREIIIEDLSVWCIIDNELELLFDLIQAGLVEKVIE